MSNTYIPLRASSYKDGNFFQFFNFQFFNFQFFNGMGWIRNTFRMLLIAAEANTYNPLQTEQAHLHQYLVVC
jgi:hypothetical protein